MTVSVFRIIFSWKGATLFTRQLHNEDLVLNKNAFW